MGNFESCKAYFEENGFIYGDSYGTDDFGVYSHRIYWFDDFSKALHWLIEAEYGERRKEFISRAEADRRLAT